MKMQIVSCPHCGTFLLDDTAECHGCGQLLGRRSGAVKTRALPLTDSEGTEICASCGETCRTGLVRCWNCSAFLRPEIEASYKRMRQSGRYEVERVELPIIDASHVTEEDALKRRSATPESFLAAHPYASNDAGGDDDFELSGQTQMDDDDDETFELNDSLLSSDQLESDSEDDAAEVFKLQAPVADSPPSAQEAGQPDGAAPEGSSTNGATETPADPVAAESAQDEQLLKIASDEEQDIRRVRKILRSKDTFVIFCPQGCRIRVKERHRGMKGKCPRCEAEFVVPKKQAPKKDEKPEPVIPSRFKRWLGDIRLHTIDPQKLRIKADSLLNECQSVDVGFAEDELLIATLVVGKFGANPKKVPPIRQAMIEHFAKQGTVATVNVPAKKSFSKELIAQISVAQPTPEDTESLFADIPVFGTNRIAVRLPKTPDDPNPKYLSFCLSEFRAFVEGLETICGISGLGANTSIPMTDEYATTKCHVRNLPVAELKKIEYYAKDPGFKLEVTGWRCAACGIVISEAARADTKLGGPLGKSIAKAKCPKCTKKFGNLPLYKLVVTTPPEPTDEPPAAAEQQQATASA